MGPGGNDLVLLLVAIVRSGAQGELGVAAVQALSGARWPWASSAFVGAVVLAVGYEVSTSWLTDGEPAA